MAGQAWWLRMKHKNKTLRTRIGWLLFLAAGLFALVLISFLTEVRTLSQFADPSGDAVSFSLPSGRYAEETVVSIRKEHSFRFLTDIYYTLDGSEPDETDLRYQGPIVFPCEETLSVNSIRAAVFYKGERSKVTTGTFLVGKNALVRHTLPSLFLTGNSGDLYGEEMGILVPGKLYDDYLADGGTEAAGWDTPANFNQTDWYRSVNAALFDAGGNCLLNEICDLSITGNSSREYEQKPLKLTAETKFTYDFGKQEQASKLPHVNRFSKLKLRNCGADLTETMLRGALVSELARQAGFEDTAMVQPVTVYLNGDYYGIADMQPVHTRSYLADLYGLDREKIEVVDRSEADILAFLGFTGEKKLDFTDAGFRKAFEELVDMDQLLRYYAFEMIVGNTDWPHNNVKMWRYTGDYVEGNPYTDGRGRFLLYDFDMAYKCDGTKQEPFEQLFYAWKNGEETEGLWDLISGLMEYGPYRSRFVNILMDDIEGVLSPENVLAVLSRCESALAPEITYAREESPFPFLRESLAGWEQKTEKLASAIRVRQEEVYSYIYQYFGGETTYELVVEAPEHGTVIEVGSLFVYGGGESLTIQRCGQYPTSLRALTTKGRQFSHWVVNKKTVTDPVLMLDESDLTDESGRRITVSLVTEAQGESVLINEVSERGDDDSVELYNSGNQTVNLREYFLTDHKEEPEKYQCPELLLAPGETVVLNGRSNPVVNEYIMNFNLKGGETVYLYRKDSKEPQDQVFIPDMQQGESYGRYYETEHFRFFDRPTPGQQNRPVPEE